MASSLTVGRFDLLDPGNSPVVLTAGFDRGAAQPTVSEIQSSVLDGSVVSGRAAGNRTVTLPVMVRGADRLETAALANEFLQLVDSPSWALTFTPDGGLPVVFDCFRGKAEVTSDLSADAQGCQVFTVTAEALPYGRSPGSQSVTLAGAAVLLDSFDTVPTVAAGPDPRQLSAPTGSIDTILPYEGANDLSVLLNPEDPNEYPFQFQVTRTGLSLSVVAGLTDVIVQASCEASTWTPAFGTQWRLDLTVSGTVHTAYSSDSPGTVRSAYAPIGFTFATALPAGTITAWELTSPVLNGNLGWEGVHVRLDYLRAFATSADLVSSANGSLLTIPSVLGSARAPAALALARSDESAFSSWCVHTPPGDALAAQPLIPLSGAGGVVTYTTAASVRYGGTYAVWLAGNFAAKADDRTIPVAFSQNVPAGGATATANAPIPAAGGSMLAYAGTVTLPVTAYPADAAAVTTTVTVTGDSDDALLDVLLLDTRGQTIIVDSTAPAYASAWVDEPQPGIGFGGAYSGTNRNHATSLAPHLAVGSTLLLNPGSSQILLYSVEGALTATLTYAPRWLQEATA